MLQRDEALQAAKDTRALQQKVAAQKRQLAEEKQDLILQCKEAVQVAAEQRKAQEQLTAENNQLHRWNLHLEEQLSTGRAGWQAASDAVLVKEGIIAGLMEGSRVLAEETDWWKGAYLDLQAQVRFFLLVCDSVLSRC